MRSISAWKANSDSGQYTTEDIEQRKPDLPGQVRMLTRLLGKPLRLYPKPLLNRNDIGLNHPRRSDRRQNAMSPTTVIRVGWRIPDVGETAAEVAAQSSAQRFPKPCRWRLRPSTIEGEYSSSRGSNKSMNYTVWHYLSS
jgi:hypothetical protein